MNNNRGFNIYFPLVRKSKEIYKYRSVNSFKILIVLWTEKSG